MNEINFSSNKEILAELSVMLTKLDWHFKEEREKPEYSRPLKEVALMFWPEIKKAWIDINEAAQRNREMLSEAELYSRLFASIIIPLVEIRKHGANDVSMRMALGALVLDLKIKESNDRSKHSVAYIIRSRHGWGAGDGHGGGYDTPPAFAERIAVDNELYNLVISIDCAFLQLLSTGDESAGWLFKYDSPFKEYAEKLLRQRQPEKRGYPEFKALKYQETKALYVSDLPKIQKLYQFISDYTQVFPDHRNEECISLLIKQFSHFDDVVINDEGEYQCLLELAAKTMRLGKKGLIYQKISDLPSIALHASQIEFEESDDRNEKKTGRKQREGVENILLFVKEFANRNEGVSVIALIDDVLMKLDPAKYAISGILLSFIMSYLRFDTQEFPQLLSVINEVIASLEKANISVANFICESEEDGSKGRDYLLHNSILEIFSDRSLKRDLREKGLPGLKRLIKSFISCWNQLRKQDSSIHFADYANYLYCMRRFIHLNSFKAQAGEIIQGVKDFSRANKIVTEPRDLLCEWPNDNRSDSWEYRQLETYDAENGSYTGMNDFNAGIAGQLRFYMEVDTTQLAILHYGHQMRVNQFSLRTIGEMSGAFVAAHRLKASEYFHEQFMKCFQTIYELDRIASFKFFNELLPLIWPYMTDPKQADQLISVMNSLVRVIKKQSLTDFMSLLKRTATTDAGEIEVLSYVFNIGNNDLLTKTVEKLKNDYARIIEYLSPKGKSLSFEQLRTAYYNEFPKDGFILAIMSFQRLFFTNQAQLVTQMQTFASLYKQLGGFEKTHLLEDLINFVWFTPLHENIKAQFISSLLEKGNLETLSKAIALLQSTLSLTKEDAYQTEKLIKTLEESTNIVADLERFTYEFFVALYEFGDDEEITQELVLKLLKKWEGRTDPLFILPARYKQQKVPVSMIKEDGSVVELSRFARFKEIVKQEILGTFQEFRYRHAKSFVKMHDKVFEAWQKNLRVELENVPLFREAAEIATEIKTILINALNSQHLITGVAEEQLGLYKLLADTIEDDLLNQTFDMLNQRSKVLGEAIQMNSRGEGIPHAVGQLFDNYNISLNDLVRAKKMLEWGKTFVGLALITGEELSRGVISWDKDNNPKIATAIESLKRGLSSYVKLDLIENDLQQIESLLKKLQGTRNIGKMVIEEQDDLMTILWIGEDPVRTCQAFTGKGPGNGALERLDDLALEPHRKIVVVKIDDESKPNTRALIDISEFGEAIGLEPTYSVFGEAFTYLIMKFMQEKIDSMPGKQILGTTHAIPFRQTFSMPYGGYFDASRGIVGEKAARSGFNLSFYP